MLIILLLLTDQTAAMPAREVIVMVEDSQNDGRITLASIHTSQTVLNLKEVSLRCHNTRC
jgi:hypothetical protein